MMDKKYVYLVTSGEYSDYCIHQIFSTKEKAEAWVNDYKHFNIEEHEIDNDNPPPQILTSVEMNYLDGDNANCYETHYGHQPDTVQVSNHVSNCRNNPLILGYFATRDQTAAVKALNEIRVRILSLYGIPQNWDFLDGNNNYSIMFNINTLEITFKSLY